MLSGDRSSLKSFFQSKNTTLSCSHNLALLYCYHISDGTSFILYLNVIESVVCQKITEDHAAAIGNKTIIDEELDKDGWIK